MAASTDSRDPLSPEQLGQLEACLLDFDRHWDPDQLRARLAALPAAAPWRRVALVEMVKIDLERRWQRGERIGLPDYLRQYPELGTPCTVPADLVRAEYEVRRQFEAVDLPMVPGYEVLAEVGRGGMGVVYRARHLQLKRSVALKMVLAGSHAGAAELARFRVEAEAIARLQHPNIVTIHEVGEHQGQPFLALEFCPGGSLDKKLGGTPLPPGEGARLVQMLAGAMQAAHEQHVVHRDLKPANVLLADDGTPKVTDFGLARKLDEAGQTASGAVLGTPSYMAPEQAGGKRQDVGPLADVYALGAILYECLTGRPPFKAATALDTLLQVRADEPVPPTRLQPRTPRDLETICLKCLRKEPGQRYGSAAALAEELQRFAAGQPIAARPVGGVERALKWARRRPATAALSVVSAVALLSLLLGGWWSFLTLRASAQRERQQRALADEYFGQALEAVDQLLAEVAEVDLAGVPHMEHRRRNLLLKAVGFYRDFLEQRGADPALRQQAGRVYRRLGDLREMLNEDAEAEQAYGRALTLLGPLAEEAPAVADHRRELARTHSHLGLLWKKHGRTGAAAEALRRALRLRRQLAESPGQPDDRRDLAESHYHLAALLAPLQDRRRQAEAGYRDALALQQELVAAFPRRPDYRRALARTFNNLGILLWKTGRPEALAAFRQSQEEGARLVKEFPDEPVYRWDLARAHNNYAGRLLASKPQDAERAYYAARDILAGLAADFPTAPRYRRELAGVCTNLGRLLRGQRRSDLAEASLRQALRLRAELVGKFLKVPDYRHELAKTEHEIGVLYHSGKPEEAEKAYRRALAIQKPLAADYPHVSEYRTDLVRTLDYLARLLLRRGKGAVPAQGRAALLDAGGCLEQAIKYQSGTEAKAARMTLCQLHFALADVRVLLGQHAQAAAAAEQLPRLSPAHLECLRAAQFLARCVLLAGEDAGLTPEERRQRQQAYAGKGVELLREAVKRGFRNRQALQAPAYEPLRRREEFHQLLEDLEQRTARAG
jgi:tetratricopeptide (TPR) repeat protein